MSFFDTEKLKKREHSNKFDEAKESPPEQKITLAETGENAHPAAMTLPRHQIGEEMCNIPENIHDAKVSFKQFSKLEIYLILEFITRCL